VISKTRKKILAWTQLGLTAKSAVVVRVSEIRDTDRGGGERVDRYQLYDHMKTIIAAPPDTHRIDEKFIREHYIPNVTGVIVLTNHKQSGLYLPPDDRRHFVMWSDRKKDDETILRCKRLWDWYAAGGIGHVVAFLASVDLSYRGSVSTGQQETSFALREPASLSVAADRAVGDGNLTALTTDATKSRHRGTRAPVIHFS
jgi:hypothetical protein